VEAMRERTWTRLAAVLVVVVLGATAAACGTGGTKADVGESSASDEPVSGEPTSNDLEQMRERLNDLGAGELGDCMSVGLAYMTLTLGVGFGSLGAALGGDPEEMQATADELADLQDQIPDAIADDFETFRSAFEQMLAQLDIGEGEMPNVLDPEFQEQLEEASAVLESPEVKEAQENIATFMEDECPDAAAGLGS
jgi:hypothetical protein